MVLEERNMLAAKLQGDIELMDDREVKLRGEYEKKISVLEEQISGLIELGKEREDKIEQVSEQLLMKNNACESLTRKYEECQRELADLREQISSDYEM